MDSRTRVVAVTQDDPFFTGSFFAAFLEECRRHGVELVEIVLLPNFNESRPALARRFLKLYGAIDFARLVVRYVASRVSERIGVTVRSVEGLASRHEVPVRRLQSINDGDYLDSLRERGVDALLSVAAPEIFRRQALESASVVLNVHNGKLPDYRGMMPTFWALLDGRSEITVSVHEMAEQIDAGQLIAEFPVPVETTDSAFEVARKAKVVAGREVAALLSRIGTARWPQPHPIDVASGSYRGFPSDDDRRRLRSTGRRML
jgi:methionyl-tRNA formyltransferase